MRQINTRKLFYKMILNQRSVHLRAKEGKVQNRVSGMAIIETFSQ